MASFLHVKHLSAQETALPECPRVSAFDGPRNIAGGTWTHIVTEPDRQAGGFGPYEPGVLPSFGNFYGSLDGQVTNVKFGFGNPLFYEPVTTEEEAFQRLTLEKVYVGTIDFPTVLRVFDGLPHRNGASFDIGVSIEGTVHLDKVFFQPDDTPEALDFPRIGSFFSDREWHLVLNIEREAGNAVVAYLLDGGDPSNVEFIVSVAGGGEEIVRRNLEAFVTGTTLREVLTGHPHPLDFSENFLTQLYEIDDMVSNEICASNDSFDIFRLFDTEVN